MGYIDLAIDPEPSGVGYDDAYPTENNERLAAQIHNTLEDMADSGYWYLTDKVPSVTQFTGLMVVVRAVIKNVFDYADSAITQYRATGSVTLSEPAASDFGYPLGYADESMEREIIRTYVQGLKIKYAIYYMWQTETDPLRIKDYIRDMLVAWPLLDTTISLKDEGGSELKIYPSWNEFG
jgi:hypothetical protein